jgi:hypothetical protein
MFLSITTSLLPITLLLLRITSLPMLHITLLGVSNTTNYLRNVMCSNGSITMYYIPGQLADEIQRAKRPLQRVNFDLFVSSIKSLEGYDYTALFVDDCTGFKWLYRLKTKDEALDVAKIWMTEISDLRAKYPLLVVMRDHAGENKSKAIQDYFTSMMVEN